MKPLLFVCLAVQPWPVFAQSASAPSEIDAKVVSAAGSGSDPRSDKGAVFSFKYGGEPDVRVKLKFDRVLEASTGDGDSGSALGKKSETVRYFTAASRTATVKKDNPGWTIAARLTYDIPKKDPLGGVAEAGEEDKSKWEFGVIQNSEGMIYKYGYGGQEFGNSVKEKKLDVSPATPAAAPFYHDKARAPVAFGETGVTVSDTPGFEAPPQDGKGANLQTASLAGKWTLWFVLRNKVSRDTIYLWTISYDVSRKWKDVSGIMTADGGAFTAASAAGRGAASPVTSGLTGGKLMNLGWSKP